MPARQQTPPRRAAGPASGRADRRGSVATVAVCLVIGFMISSSAMAARGTDLRPARTSDLAELVSTQAQHIQQLKARSAELEREVDRLGHQAAPTQQPQEPLTFTAVRGPGVRVTLTDAPSSVSPEGVDADLLVVHQQDIQAVLNVMWEAGAEAVTIQGQRVIATTGIKCVGNTVVLHDVPHAPPYVIEAIGDQRRIVDGLSRSHEIDVYKEYAKAYSLGYRQENVPDIVAPAYGGPAQLRHARVG